MLVMMTVTFEVKASVRQGCVMSTVLFNLVVDWIMRRATEDKVRGIRWTPLSYLEEREYTVDSGLALLQETTQLLNFFAKQVHQQTEKVQLPVNFCKN